MSRFCVIRFLSQLKKTVFFIKPFCQHYLNLLTLNVRGVLGGVFTMHQQRNNTRSYRYCSLSFFVLVISGGIMDKCYALAPLDKDDTIKPYVAVDMLYDSNFLRISDDADPVAVIGENDTSEFIKQISAGLEMDWAISRQHIIIDANINQNWFQNFSSLDYIGWDTRAQWNWQIRNNLDGEIGYINIERLGNFDFLNALIPNLINTQRYFANAEYLFHPNGKVKFGLFRTENQFVNRVRQFSDNIEDNAELHLQYLSPTGGNLGFRFRATDGEYPNRSFNVGDTQDDAYVRFNYALTWSLAFSTKTDFDGFLGYTEQQHDHLSVRNFSGIVGQLNLHWHVSEKTLVELSAIRNINQTQNIFASFSLIEGVEFNFTWHTTPKIDLMLLTSYQQQKFLGNSDINIADFEQQKNYTGNIGFHLIYSPTDNISVNTVLNYENRDSNNPLRSYDTQSAEIQLKAAF